MVKITRKEYLCLVLTGRYHFFQCVLGGILMAHLMYNHFYSNMLYVVCEYNEGFMIPCIYTLSTKKDELTYSKIFHNIIKLGVDRQGVTMKPSHLTCGFEIVVIEAFKNIFSEAQVKTCFFH